MRDTAVGLGRARDRRRRRRRRRSVRRGRSGGRGRGAARRGRANVLRDRGGKRGRVGALHARDSGAVLRAQRTATLQVCCLVLLVNNSLLSASGGRARGRSCNSGAAACSMGALPVPPCVRRTLTLSLGDCCRWVTASLEPVQGRRGGCRWVRITFTTRKYGTTVTPAASVTSGTSSAST